GTDECAPAAFAPVQPGARRLRRVVHQRPPGTSPCSRPGKARLGGGRPRQATVRGRPGRGEKGRGREGRGGAETRRPGSRRGGARLGGGDGRGRRLWPTGAEREPGSVPPSRSP